MQQFSESKKHISILTHSLVSFVLVSILFLSPSPTYAQQTGTLGKDKITTNAKNCQYDAIPQPGGVYQCTDKDGKITTAQQAGNQQTAAQAATAFDPTAGCANGINTGLGCIPYETRGFTGALLGFLAGLAGGISLIIMLVATIQIMTGGDNAEQVKKGKELFTGAITGLLFIIFSVTLMKVVAGDIIQLPGFTNTTSGPGGERP